LHTENSNMGIPSANDDEIAKRNGRCLQEARQLFSRMVLGVNYLERSASIILSDAVGR